MRFDTGFLHYPLARCECCTPSAPVPPYADPDPYPSLNLTPADVEAFREQLGIEVSL